jgi:hypothetical protein
MVRGVLCLSSDIFAPMELYWEFKWATSISEDTVMVQKSALKRITTSGDIEFK